MPGPSLLFDSNVFYAAIGISPGKIHPDAEIATRLMELARKLDCHLYLAEVTQADIDQAKDQELRKASSLAMKQWNVLGRVPVAAAFLGKGLVHGDRYLQLTDEAESSLNPT